MSFLTGKTEQLSGSTPGTQQAHQQLLDFLFSGQGLNRLFPGTQVDPASMQPYLDLFTQQNTRNFAQAKESAGNLTGSGLGNIIGAEAGRANVAQGAFLADLFEARRREDANRAASLFLGGIGSPAGQVQNVYRPGALDYLFQGVGAAAPFFPYGGGK